MTDRLREFERLSRLCWQAVAERTCLVSGRRVGIPSHVAQVAPIVDGRYGDDFPVLAHLDEALKHATAAGFEAIATSFAALEPAVQWSQNPSYTKENCDPSLLDGYAYAALSGPDGPIQAAAPRGGFYLMGPGVLYPDHHHAPREVYLVFSGGVEWRLDGGDWFEVPAGSLIFHDAWQLHGMRSAARPVLAFAGWIEPGERGSIRFGG